MFSPGINFLILFYISELYIYLNPFLSGWVAHQGLPWQPLSNTGLQKIDMTVRLLGDNIFVESRIPPPLILLDLIYTVCYILLRLLVYKKKKK